MKILVTGAAGFIGMYTAREGRRISRNTRQKQSHFPASTLRKTTPYPYCIKHPLWHMLFSTLNKHPIGQP